MVLGVPAEDSRWSSRRSRSGLRVDCHVKVGWGSVAPTEHDRGFPQPNLSTGAHSCARLVSTPYQG